MQRAKADDPLVMLCYGDEDRAQLFEQCERVPEIDALSKGVVTTWGVYEIEPPPKLDSRRATRDAQELGCHGQRTRRHDHRRHQQIIPARQPFAAAPHKTPVSP